MKKAFPISAFLSLLITSASAQSPVSWNYTIKKVQNNMYEVHLTANLGKGWHIYAQEQPEDAIAMPTKIQFNNNPLLTIKGKPKEEGHRETYSNKTVGISAYQYAEKVDFKQEVLLKAAVKTTIAGKITFQTCTEQECLPPQTIPFSLEIQ